MEILTNLRRLLNNRCVLPQVEVRCKFCARVWRFHNMTRNAWRDFRTVVRYVIYAYCVIIVLLAVFFCGSLIMNPFAGFAGSSEFANKSGHAAKRLMNEWPSSVTPSNVRSVSRKHDYSIDSHSAWYKIELDIDSARKWADSVHSDRELHSRQSIRPDDRGLEGVRRMISGPPPLHWATGDSPKWWAPPPVEFRATEAMKWYSGYDSGVGQAAYTGFDSSHRTLWVYEYSCQHDRLWEPNQMPDGDVFSRLHDTEANVGPTPSTVPSEL